MSLPCQNHLAKFSILLFCIFGTNASREKQRYYQFFFNSEQKKQLI